MIIEPELGAAPPADECQSPSQSTEEVANSLLCLSRVSNNSAPTVATQQPVAMETEEAVMLAAEQGEEVKSEREGHTNEGEEEEVAHRVQVLEESSGLQMEVTEVELEEKHGDRSNHTSQENQPDLTNDVHHEQIKDDVEEEEEEEMIVPAQQVTLAAQEEDEEKVEDDQKEVYHILPISDVPTAICTITSTAAAQGTHSEAQDNRASPLEDYKSHRASPPGNYNTNRASPLDKYDSHKHSPLQNYKASPPLSYSPHRASPLEDYLPNIRGENYKIHKVSSSASPDIIEVQSDRSEEKEFDDMDGDDEHDDEDSLSQRSTVTDESEMFDITRGNLGLLEQAIALKAEQVKPAGPSALLCAPDIHHQRYFTMDDRPKHLDVIRKSYFGKGRAEGGNKEGRAQLQHVLRPECCNVEGGQYIRNIKSASFIYFVKASLASHGPAATSKHFYKHFGDEFKDAPPSDGAFPCTWFDLAMHSRDLYFMKPGLPP